MIRWSDEKGLEFWPPYKPPLFDTSTPWMRGPLNKDQHEWCEQYAADARKKYPWMDYNFIRNEVLRADEDMWKAHYNLQTEILRRRVEDARFRASCNDTRQRRNEEIRLGLREYDPFSGTG